MYMETENKTITVYIDGPLDARSLSAVQEKVDNLEVKLGNIVVMDCTEMSYICSAGLRIFLAMHKDLTQRGAKLIIKSLQPMVYNIFKMTGFSQILNFED